MPVDLVRLKAVFSDARDRTDPAERAAYLDAACAGDADLRARVEALLQASTGADSVLDTPGPALDSGIGAATPATRRGTGVSGSGGFSILGDRAEGPGTGALIAWRYLLLRQIGEGGMGSVWEAEQTAPITRRVAVKLIRTDRGHSEAIVSRFEAERQAIALMDHPHIAKLLDAGTTDDGSPFFVMELVPGVPLNVFCDEHKLSIPERLALFAQICGAVQHAHQKGIIHRDLKPSNILVDARDGKPVPKVIDFGLAKATTGLRLSEHTQLTGFGALVGTPLYMAPEQAAANVVDVDTRADIYALGVILFELLTGSTPLARETLRKAPPDELLRLIREEEAPSPSSRLSSATDPAVAANRRTESVRLGRLVRGELDWIVLKALAKDRDRRYETANGFARDIERCLNHEPVQAGPPSASYRFKKFVRRNRGPVLAVGLVLFALVVGVIGTTLGLIEAQRQTAARDQALAAATAERTRAEENETKAKAEAAAKEQARAAEKVERENAQKAQAETHLAYTDAVDVIDTMTSELVGDVLTSQKELSTDQKRVLTAALATYQKYVAPKGDDEKSRVRTAIMAYRVGLIESRLGRRAQAVASFRTARGGFEKLIADFNPTPEHRNNLAFCSLNLGTQLLELGELVEAEKLYREALGTFENLTQENPKEPEFRRGLGSGHNLLGTLLSSLGKWTLAREHFQLGLAIRQRLATEFPRLADHQKHLAIAHTSLGHVLHSMGKQEEAQEQLKSALAICEQLSSRFPEVADYRHGLAHNLTNFGGVLCEQGKREEGLEQFQKALTLREKLVEDFPARPDYRMDLARVHVNLGKLLRERGTVADAQERYKRAQTLLQQLVTDFPTVPAYRTALAKTLTDLGDLLPLLGTKREQAQRELYQQALTIQERLVADSPDVTEYQQDLAETLWRMGAVLGNLGKRPEARDHYRKALTWQEKLAVKSPNATADRVDLGKRYTEFAAFLVAGMELEESVVWYDKAIATLAAVHDQNPHDTRCRMLLRDGYSGRAVALNGLRRFADAVKDWDRAIELTPKERRTFYRVGRVVSLRHAGKVAEALAEVAEWPDRGWVPGQRIEFACVYALASARLADHKKENADKAMALLKEAARAGFNNVARLKSDTDLDALRDRDDFKALVAELEERYPSRPERTPPRKKE
jgi:serine/threonine protein kinase/tetratricopeptide (TPR) repeat protein